MSQILEIVKEGKCLSGELIIDSHCHCGSAVSTISNDNSPEKFKGTLERVGIDKACLCTRGAGVIGDPFLGNNLTAKYVKAASNMFLGYVTIPANYYNYVQEIERGEKIGLTLGVKMHTYRQKHDINEHRFHDMLEYLNSKNMILLHHYFGPPDRLEPILKRYKNITFLEGHCVFEYAELAKKYDNMYINTCAEIGFDNIRRIVELSGEDKIIYGSDMTALDTTFSLGAVAYAKIPDESKRKIFGTNMQRLIKRIKI